MKDKGRCGICEIPYFERNNYFYGKLMTVRDFFAEQCYFNEKRWLINRMINGWGVVCGLDVQPVQGAADKVRVTPGMAIDCCGREILVCEEQEVRLAPEESECHKQKSKAGEGERKLSICIEYHECKTEHLQLPPIACDQKEKGEFNRIRDSFKIHIVEYKEMPEESLPCPLETRSESMHRYVCERLRKGCPECPDSQCINLATVTVDQNGNLIGEIDTCSKRKLVYSNSLLYKLIECLHHNYIGTWLVLGPIFNVTHQAHHHSPGDGHPLAQDIIYGFDENLIKEITGDINKAPRHGDTIHYKNEAIDIAGEYTWRTRSFSDMDWMNIHDIEDDIHQHLPGDFDDPLDPDNPLNFAGKHHTLAYFLVYILSPEQRETRLFVRSDDSLRVWLNGHEIEELRYAGERDIRDFTESSARITLKEGCNILMAAVAETHYEWGFSARIENDGGLRFTTIKPE